MRLLLNIHETNQYLYTSIQKVKSENHSQVAWDVGQGNMREKLLIIIDVHARKYMKNDAKFPQNRIKLAEHVCLQLLTQIYELGLSRTILYLKKDSKYVRNRMYQHFINIMKHHEMKIKFI